MNEKILVSMTSYPGRISNVGKAIYLLLSKQTRKPDEIHLWLSVEEFPNKEKDLPQDLINILFIDKVKLHWVPKNTYVHKRHEIFKQTTDEDCVFLIDDDVRYADDLIEKVMDAHKTYPDSIICYNQYNPHLYNGKHILYKNNRSGQGPHTNVTRWCGQSMIPSKLYPKEILDDAHQEVRNKTSPISDECWFQPWIVYNDISIYHLKYGWGTDIDPKKGKNTGLVSFSHQKESNGYERRDNWLFAVLSAYPQILEKYKRLFNYG